MSGGPSSGVDVDGLAARIWNRAITAPLLAAVTAVIAAVIGFGEELAEFLGLGSAIPTTLLGAVFGFAEQAIAAAAATSAGEVSTLGVIAFGLGVAVAGIGLYVVSRGVWAVVGR